MSKLEIIEKFQLKLSTDTQPADWVKYRNRRTFVEDEAKNIVSLNLVGCGATDATFLQHPDFQHLQALNLSENQLSAVHFPAGFDALRFLNLEENGSLREVKWQDFLNSNLEVLLASECAIESLSLPLQCPKLEKVDLRKNKLTSSPIRGRYSKLTFLDLSQNNLKSFWLRARIQELEPKGFEALQYLFLNDNQLEELRFEWPLESLNTLHLKGNQLSELPANLLAFKSLASLYLHGNPLPTMRDVILGEENGNSWGTVRVYLESLQKKTGTLKYLHQAKMVLVGNGEVGKSSVRIKLLDKTAPLPKKHERTPGLDIQHYFVKNLETNFTNLRQNIDFQLNIWDFGGQGKYREVQQLFCTRKTLYLFVTAHDDQPTNEDYVGFEYWLSMVNAFSFDESAKECSPVIHVVNKIDEETRLVNQADCLEMFDNISHFVKISCETLKNFSELETAIREVLPKVSSDIFTALFHSSWVAVKTDLENRQPENHITQTEYRKICEAQNLNENEATAWLRILDRIGTVIFFGENPDLKDWIVLNPIWVKDALYKVLDSQLADGGILKPVLFPAIWQGYTPDEHQKLLGLMLAYKLCYRQLNARDEPEFVVPALLPDIAPAFPSHLKKPDFQLKFIFEPFLPAGTVNKLMVMLHDNPHISARTFHSENLGEKMGRAQPLHIEINKDFVWKNNLIASDPANSAHAHIREDWNKKSVSLDLFGNDVQPLFETIRNTLESLNQDLKSTKYLSNLNFKTEAFYKNKWRDLDNLEELGIEFFPINQSKIKSMRPKVFISYAHKEDSRYMKLFVEGIKAHSDWEIFDDRQILLGQDWHERLQTEVAECDCGIMLISPQFFKSDYIKQHEFEDFVKRNAQKGFPFFGMLLVNCDFGKWEEISKRQLFVAHGQDYDLAKTHRDKQISFDKLVRFDSDGEILPNSFRNDFCENFVTAVNKALKKA